jgi:hypothetical protein
MRGLWDDLVALWDDLVALWDDDGVVLSGGEVLPVEARARLVSLEERARLVSPARERLLPLSCSRVVDVAERTRTISIGA